MVIEVWAAAASAVAAAFMALWWGERARRIDAQRREEKIPVIASEPPKPVEVRVDHSVATPSVAEFDEAREKYILECIEEGHTRKASEEDWDTMMERHHADGPITG